MAYKLILFFALLGSKAFPQMHTENPLFSFSTTKGKLLQLSLDTVDNVLIYRYGKEGQTELEIKDDLDDTITVFTYSFYLRGGGVSNAGLDLNYVTFYNADHNYTIYSEYSAELNETTVGIRIADQTKGTSFEIEGVPGSMKGSLVAAFRWSELIPLIEHE